MAQALAPAAAEALAFVQEEQAVNADETGFTQGREEGRAGRAWLWVVATALVVVFHIARSRGGQVARHLLGEDFAGILTTDRWSAYGFVEAGQRQVCWAHLTRDFQGFIDRGGEGGRIGRELMRERHRFFKWYHRVREGTLAREAFEKRMRGAERRVGPEPSPHIGPRTSWKTGCAASSSAKRAISGSSRSSGIIGMAW